MAAPLGEGVRVGCLGPGFVWTWKDMGFRERSVLGEAGSSDRAPHSCAHLLICLYSSPRLPPLTLGTTLSYPITSPQRGEPVIRGLQPDPQRGASGATCCA